MGSSTDRLSEFAGEPTAAWSVIQRRASLLKQVRQFFDDRGFTEVTTPVLSSDTVVDRHLDPIVATLDGQSRWLQTSPEFAMKRLLAKHRQSIYQITPAFRCSERGAMHNPEFTMLEWYGVGHDQQQGIDLLAGLACELFDRGSIERVSYRDAFEARWKVDPHRVSDLQLAKIGQSIGEAPSELDRDGWLDWIMSESIQPELGSDSPVALYHYPASQAALACLVEDGDVQVAERFELFYKGVELANGYHELRDADELRRRMEEVNGQSQRDGKEALPVENRLLAAMEHGLPSCAGVAMGLDRVLMLLVDAERIDDVISFPSEIA